MKTQNFQTEGCEPGDLFIPDGGGRSTEMEMGHGLAKCARLLLGGSETENPVQDTLDGLAMIPGIQHAVLFQIESYHAEDLRGRWLACATLEGCSSCEDKQDYLPYIDHKNRNNLEKGQSCYIPVDQLRDELQPHFLYRNVTHLLMIPLAVCGTWWGNLCIEISSTASEKISALISDLETIAALLSVFYERQQVIEGYQERDKLSGALEMAGTVCHKLNQPMQVILGYASMVTSGDISEVDQIKEVVQLIEDETRQMGIITKNLMGITKNRSAE